MFDLIADFLWMLLDPRPKSVNKNCAFVINSRRLLVPGAAHLIEFLGAQGENADNLICIACDALGMQYFFVLDPPLLFKKRELFL